jgi:hypothetical protein
MTISIDYQLLNHGWAECTVQFGEVSQKITASYLSDALGNLVLSAAAILSGVHSVSNSFDEEPGEYRWVIERAKADDISIQLLAFNELWGNKSNSEGVLLLQTTCHSTLFAGAVHKAACTVLIRHGEAGYKDNWHEHEFPSRQLDLLSSYIKSWQQI